MSRDSRTKPRFIAVIPAAGESRRMGTCKLSLPLAGKPAIFRVIDALTEGGADHVAAVLGPKSSHLSESLAGFADVLTLSAQTADMRATVVLAIEFAEKTWDPVHSDYLVLAPADVCMLDSASVRALMETARSNPGWIVLPRHESRRGHPVLIPWELTADIRSAAANQGINSVIRRFDARVLEIPLGEVTIWDMDSPEDYRRMSERFH